MNNEFFSLDYECYWSSHYSVKELGNFLYCSDPLFNAYLVAIVGPGIEFVGHPTEFNWSLLSGKTVVSHNASFDECVYFELLKRKLIPPVDPPANWHCSSDLSAFLGCSSRALDSATEILLEQKIDKTLRNYTKNRIFADESPEMQQQIKDYALTDAKTCLAIWNEYNHLWPEKERQVSNLNRQICYKGIGVDIEKAKLYNAKVTLKIFDTRNRLKKIGFSDNEAIQSPRKFYSFCEKFHIPKPTSLDKKVNPHLGEWIRKYSPEYPWIKDYFDLKQYSSLFKNRMDYISKARREDGSIPYSLLYQGCHTGRFSATGGFSMHTLPKETLDGIDMRSLFVPRDRTKKMGIIDFSAIEPRILLLMSGQTDVLDMVRNGHNIYEAHARLHLGWKGGKLKVENPSLYALCKAMVIGLGYGTGNVKFRELLASIYGLTVTQERSVEIVNDFRKSNPGITRLWSKYNQLLANNIDGHLPIQLPSGRWLKLINIKRDEKGDTYCRFGFGGLLHKVYGAKIVENIIQAIAADLLKEAMLRVAQAGYEILFTVHDEIVVQLEGQNELDKVAAIMRIPPVWMPNLPIEVDATLTDYYKK